MKWRLAGLSAGMIAIAGAALADPECRPIPPPQDQPYPGTIRLHVDAADVNHRVFHIHETLPVAGREELVLLYPEWLPGTHSPTGRNRINKVAGLTVSAVNTPLGWRRDSCDVFAFRITPPQGAASIDVDFDYLSADSGQNGPGSSAEVSPDLLVLEWSSMVLYPAGYNVRGIEVDPSVTLPQGWEFATALDRAPDYPSAPFKRTSLETLIDSPLFAGRYAAHWELDPGAPVPVRLNVFADRPELLKAKDLDKYIGHHRALVQQAYKLFGSQHYDHYDFLLAVSENIRKIGLEHHRSSENVTSPEYFTGWDKTMAGRDLLPHEYTHSWNGKFRRPKELWTANYNVSMGDSLLWVYEGQTQYWGKILAARSGLWSKEEALDALANTAAYYKSQPGRRWRSLQDTTYDEVLAPRFVPQSWASWRRSEDYYNEGSLLWLDVDTLIRELSQGQRSLDDFARNFFGVDDGNIGPQLYDFDDVVRALSTIQPYDWASFLRARLDDLDREPLDGVTRGGYRLTFTDTAGKYTESAEKTYEFTGFFYSLGLNMGKGGKVSAILWDSPAFAAGLAPGVQIMAVNGIAYEPDRLKEAVKNSPNTTAPIELITKDDDHFGVVRIDYHDGPRYPHLERIESTRPRLDDIVAAK